MGETQGWDDLSPQTSELLTRMLADSGISAEDLEIALAERFELAALEDDGKRPVSERILAHCTPLQRGFVASNARRRVGLKGRRAGGSYGIAAWLLLGYEGWSKRGSFYIGRTLESAVTILWETLIEYNELFQLGASFDGSNHIMTLPNGYWIRIYGAKDKRQIDNMRGPGKGLVKACIDESGFFAGEDELFSYMVKSVLTPQLMDSYHLGGGQLALVGNSGPLRRGFYYETSMHVDRDGNRVPNSPWEVHYWTALDNTAIDARSFFLEVLTEPGSITREGAEAGWTPEGVLAWLEELRGLPYHDPRWYELERAEILSPEFMREYLSRWVDDPSALIYRVPPELVVDSIDVSLGNGWRIAIGIDVGWSDGNAFTVVAKHINSAEFLTLESYYIPELDSAQIAAEGLRLSREYRTGEVYVDTGGEGGKRLQDLANHGLYAMAQAKTEKKPRIEYGRSLLRTGNVRFSRPRCAQLLTEMTGLPWDKDRRNHREGYVDDCCDSWLAAVWALTSAFVPKDPPRPKEGTQEHEDYLDRIQHERDMARYGRRKRR